MTAICKRGPCDAQTGAVTKQLRLASGFITRPATRLLIKYSDCLLELTNKLTNQFHGTVLLEKLKVTQLVTTFLAFYGTRRFITVFKRAPTAPCSEPDASSPQLPTLLT